MSSTKSVFIFCFSRELLEGIVVDRNGAFMAARISDLGYRVRTIQILDSIEEEMVDAFQRALKEEPAFILTTGGMGPAVHDITRKCVAKAAGVPSIEDPRALEMLRVSYRRLAAKNIITDPEINDARRVIAQVPQGAVCYENPIGTAPLVRFQTGPTTFFLLPGVPAELQRLFTLYVAPAMTAEGPGMVKKARHVDYHGQDESAISRMLDDISRRHTGVVTRCRVQGTEENLDIHITLFGEHSDEAELDRMLESAEMDLRARLGLEVAARQSEDEAGLGE